MSKILEKLKQPTPKKELYVPEWDETVYVKRISTQELAKVTKEIKDMKDTVLQELTFRGYLARYAIVDAEGKYLLEDDSVPLLLQNAPLVTFLWETMADVNVLT